MTKEELKRKQYDTWNKYYQKHKSEINARRKKVREGYKNKLSVAEKRIAELEKENAELKLKLEALEGQTPWKDIKDKSEITGQLTKAKEIIKNLLILKNDHYGNTKMEWRVKVTEQAEQFLNSEVEK